MPPLYQFECYINHHVYDAIRPLSHSGVESCDMCESEGKGFAFAHRVISRTSVHIPGRSTLRKLEDDTVAFANKQTRIAEAKARKVTDR